MSWVRSKWVKWFELVVRVALGAVFVYAGFVKGTDISAFADSVANYQIFPHAYVYLVAATVPSVEVVLGMALIFGKGAWRSSSALVLVFLNVVFIVVLASAIYRGLDIDCGCFSSEGPATTPLQALLRDIPIFLSSVFVYWSTNRDLRRSLVSR